MQRKLVVLCAVTGLILCIALVISVTIGRSNVSARSLDKRLKIYQVRYFPGDRYNYAFFPKGTQWFQYQWQRLLSAFSTNALPPVAPINQRGVGPALLICGELKEEETPFFELVTDKGERLLPPKNIGSPGTEYAMNRFLWRFVIFDPNKVPSHSPITNGTYRMRIFGDTNDLAIIRIR